MAKRKGKEIQEDLMRNDHAFIPDDKGEATISDENIFLDDIPYVRPINEKEDKDGLYIFQHVVILHVSILANYFPDELFPTDRAKCLQYYEDRELINLDVKPETFIKTYSKFIQIDIKNGRRIIANDKFIRSEFIDKITPFILRWYPHAIWFIQRLNTTPYIIKPKYFYWIYREVRSKFRGSMEDFRMEFCAHISEETFRTWNKRFSERETPDDIKEYIQQYIEFHFPTNSKKE